MEKDYLLHKVLNGIATPDEIETLQQDPTYKSYLKIAETASGFETPSFDQEANFEKITNRLSSEKKISKTNPFASLLRIAAVIAVLLAGYLFVNNLDTKVETGIAETKTVILPDDSQVTLNAASKIAYKKRNWDKKRVIDLEGEAYFKVAKGKQFDVKTPQGTVSVLGTQFNVYARDNTLFVQCYEGLVQVTNSDTLINVTAGTKLKMVQGKYISNTTSQKSNPSWVNNETDFDNVNLNTVIEQLKRHYPIMVNIEGVDTNQNISGSFTHKNLDVALQSICNPLGLRYTIKDNEVTIYAEAKK